MNFEWLEKNAEAVVLMLVMSIVGGAAQYMQKIRSGKALFSITELLGEALISASAGMTAGLFLVDHASLPMALAGASLAGHMGTRLIYALENMVTRRLEGKIDG